MRNVLIKADTGEVLFGEGEHTRQHHASLTKLMTLYLVFNDLKSNKISLEQTIPIPTLVQTYAREMANLNMNGDGFRYSVAPNPPQYPIHDLIKAAAGASDSYAVTALATVSCKTAFNKSAIADERGYDYFVQRMNHMARQLGLFDTSFQNAIGMPANDHYSTPYEVALLLQTITKEFPNECRDYLGQKTYTAPSINRTFNNTSQIIRNANHPIVGKTGRTNNAGYCFAAKIGDDDNALIGVVMGAKSAEDRDSAFYKLITKTKSPRREQQRHA